MTIVEWADDIHIVCVPPPTLTVVSSLRYLSYPAYATSLESADDIHIVCVPPTPDRHPVYTIQPTLSTLSSLR